MEQMGRAKRQKSQESAAIDELGNVETPSSGEANLG
jgi:hypothetical protein